MAENLRAQQDFEPQVHPLRRRFEQRLRFVAATAGAAAAIGVFAAIRYRNLHLDRETARLASLLGAFPGARLAEVGAGKGNIAFRIAERLGPTGILIATDVDPSRLRILRKKAAQKAVQNVTVLAASEDNAGLPPDSCQGIYLRGAYHHLTHPEQINRSLFQSLKPGGVLIIIDFNPRLLLAPWTPKGIPENRGGHGIRPELVIHELKNAGFRFLQSTENWPGWTYCLVFQKP